MVNFDEMTLRSFFGSGPAQDAIISGLLGLAEETRTLRAKLSALESEVEELKVPARTPTPAAASDPFAAKVKSKPKAKTKPKTKAKAKPKAKAKK